jgi:hypothetical protein
VLYAIFGALITAIQGNRVNDILGHGFLGFLESVPDSLMLGLVSIFYALAIAVIPFIAKRVISGDVGSTAFSFVRAGATAASAGLATVSGFAAGISSASGGTATLGSSSSSASAALSSSSPPPVPSMPDFIRSGIASAMHSNSSPTASRNVSQDERQMQLASTSAGNRTNAGYRPHSVTQVVSFNVARALGRAAGQSKSDNN